MPNSFAALEILPLCFSITRKIVFFSTALKLVALAATSSIAAIRGNSFAPAYSASKAYMSTYMEGLYIKAGRLKLPLYITDIQPGFVKTNMAKGPGQFWVSSVEKAAQQIYRAIKNRKRKVYITKRWWLIAKLMSIIPIFIYKKIG